MEAKGEPGQEPQRPHIASSVGDSSSGRPIDPMPPSEDSNRGGEYPPLSETERQRLLGEFNDTRVEYPRDRCVHQLFEEQAARTPTAVALVCDGESLTYDQLNRRANQLAHHLRTLGVGPENLVGLWLEPSLDLVIGLLGILKAGAAYVPIDRVYPPERAAFMLAECQAPVLVTEKKFAAKLTSVSLAKICLDDAGEAVWKTQPVGNVEGVVGPDNLAYVIYTSGTTGQPKGSLLTHRNVARLFAATEQWFGFNAQDVWTLFHSAAFDFSVWEIWGALLYGGRLVVVPFAVSRSPESFCDLLERERVTVLNQTPTAFGQFMLAEARHPLGRLALRYVIFGGEALVMESLRGWFERHGDQQPRLVNMYGITETTVHVTYRPLTAKDIGARSVIGVPIPDLRLHILDERHQPVPVGVPGEIYVGGAGVARGYLNRPELTAQRFVPDPFTAAPEARLYRSGDRARQLPGGDIEYLGRLDDQVKLRGFRIELGEIESVLAGTPEVAQAVVLVREDTPGDKRLVAFVTPKSGATPEPGALAEQLRTRLPDYMVPAAFVVLEALPLTPNGKVDRKALAALPVAASARTQAAMAPRTPQEQIIWQVWCEILGQRDLGVQDDFFALGGHSLLAMRAAARLGQELQREFPVRWFFEHRTVAALAAQLAGAQTPSGPGIVPVPRDRPLPLSHEQERLWFLHRLNPDSCAYNVPVAVRLRGPLGLDALAGALAMLEQRHELLRTTFGEVEGQPFQEAHPAGHLRLEREDLREVPEGERAARLAERLREEARRPFDLAVAPLLRVRAFELSDQEHVLLFNAHHIICDEWSLRVLLRELEALVAAGLDEARAALPALPVQYADYAVWQREHANEAAREADRTFWRAALAGAPARLDLPADHARPLRLSDRGQTLCCTLPADLVQALERLGRQQGATAFTTWLTLFRALLERCSGQTDVVIGTPLAYRQRAALQGVFGFFLNTLPLRGEPAGERSFAQAVRREHEAARQAFAHGELSFGEMVRLHPGAHAGQDTPLFSTSFVFLEEGPVPARWLGCETETVLVEPGTAKFELMLSLERRADGTLQCVWEYSTDLFATDTVERFQGLLATLATQVSAHPEVALGQLDILPAAERQRLLVEFNATRGDYPQDRCLHQLFEEQVARTPAAVALIEGERRWTYAELNVQANQLAHHLAAGGIAAGDPVALHLDRSAQFVIAVLAILKAGGCYVPLPGEYPVLRLRFMLEDSQARLLISRGSLSEGLCPASCRGLDLEREAATIAGCPTGNPTARGQAEDAAYVMYTSGSTGQAKGVVVPHRAVCRLVHGQSFADFGPDLRTLLLAPPAFDASTFELWAPLLHGGSCVVCQERLPELGTLETLLRDQQVNCLWLTAGLFNQILDLRPSMLVGVAHVLAGGEALSLPHVRKAQQLLPHTRLTNGYGPTECTTFACTHTITPEEVFAAGSVPIGRPIANTRAYVLDEQRQLCPIGSSGELYLGGDGLAHGYLNRPDLTAEKFVPDPFSAEPGARMYRTGDRARWRTDGNLEYLGRLDDQVKLRGFRIELGEIESVLAGTPAVAQAVVLVREDTAGDKRLVAFVTPKAGATPEPGALAEQLRTRLPDYMVPAAFVVLAALPLTPNGKVDRKALAALGVDARASLVGAEPLVTPTERAIAAIWCQLLGLERVGATDDFFALGGHSLLAVRLLDRVQKEFAVLLPLSTLLTCPQVRNMAGEIDRRLVAQPENQADQKGVAGNAPPLFLLGWYVHTEGVFSDEQLMYVLPFPEFGQDAATCRVEHLADRCLKSLRAVRPRGPYLLAGFSLAGLVGFEIARRLRQQGEEVALVVVIDTAPAATVERLGLRGIESIGGLLGVRYHRQLLLARLWIQANEALADTRRLGLRGGIRTLRGLLPALYRRFKAGAKVRMEEPGPRPTRQGGASPAPAHPTAQNFGRFWRHIWAHTRYRPQRYDGAVTLILSETTAAAVGTPDGGWGRWAKRVDTIVMPGNHHSVVGRDRAVLAAKLTALYRAALGRPVNPEPKPIQK